MADSTLPLTLLGLNSNPDVVKALLAQTTFPRERPSYWVRYPNIGADLDVSASLAFAKKSVMHAITIAQSSATGSATLAELAKFSQKTVKRIVALHANLSPETAAQLTRWAVKYSDVETLQNLANSQDPRVWVPEYMALTGKYADGYAQEMARAIARQTSPGTVEQLFHQVYAYESASAESKASACQVHFLNACLSGHAGADVDIVALLHGISDPARRMLTAVSALARVGTGGGAPSIPDGYASVIADGLAAHAGSTSRLQTFTEQLQFLPMGPSAARILLAADSPAADHIVFAGLAFGQLEWDADLINEVARRLPTKFVDRFGTRGDKLCLVLTDETFAHMVRTADPWAWDRATDPAWADRMACLDPQVSLSLFFRLQTQCVSDFLTRSDPSFSPEDLASALAEPFDTIGYRGTPAAHYESRPVNRSFTASGLDRSATDLARTALHSLLQYRYIDDRYTPSGWVLRLLDLCGTVTGERAVHRGDDPTQIDVWTFAVHHHLDALLHDIPEAWMPALSLLDGWSGTLTELAYASAEMIGHQLPHPEISSQEQQTALF